MSKSVTLIASPATTGSTKKTAMTTSAGAANHHATCRRPIRRTDARLYVPPTLGASPLRWPPGGAVRARGGPSRSLASPREQPAPLFEDAVGACIELAHRLVDGPLSARRALGDVAHLVGDAFPLGHFRRRLHALELLAKCARMRIGGKRRVLPRASARRQVAGHFAKTQLDIGPRQIFDELPCGILSTRRAKHD